MQHLACHGEGRHAAAVEGVEVREALLDLPSVHAVAQPVRIRRVRRLDRAAALVPHVVVALGLARDPSHHFAEGTCGTARDLAPPLVNCGPEARRPRASPRSPVACGLSRRR